MSYFLNVIFIAVLFFFVSCSDNKKPITAGSTEAKAVETFPESISLKCEISTRQGYSSRELAMKNPRAALASSKFRAMKSGDEAKGVELTTIFTEVVTLKLTSKDSAYHQYFGAPDEKVHLGNNVHLHLMAWVDSGKETSTEKVWAKSKISAEVFRKEEGGKYQVLTSLASDEVDRVLGHKEKLSVYLSGTEHRTALYNIKDKARIFEFKHLVDEKLAPEGFLVSSSVTCER